MIKNLVSFSLTEEESAAVKNAGSILDTILKPKLISLTDELRKSTLKMGDKNVPFVSKSLEYADKNTNLVPAFLNVQELRVDFNAVVALSEIYNVLYPIVSLISDTMMESGSEAYSAALLFYETAKLAAKMNVPGAKEIVDDLSKRFKGQGNFGNGSADNPPANPQ
ncbi:MAG: hypothetical protein M1480_20540 [Bacteroidetes bacterium]|nr:hypothetical protein [Bacteroidota bacterium]